MTTVYPPFHSSKHLSPDITNDLEWELDMCSVVQCTSSSREFCILVYLSEQLVDSLCRNGAGTQLVIELDQLLSPTSSK